MCMHEYEVDLKVTGKRIQQNVSTTVKVRALTFDDLVVSMLGLEFRNIRLYSRSRH